MHYYIDAGARTTWRSSGCSRTRSCGSSSSRTPTATSTRSTSSGCGARTCATTTATGRPRSATASTRTATSRTTSSTTRRAPRRSRRATPIAARRRRRSRRRMAMKGLLDRIGFAFQVNWHSNGQWLLYAEGWQIATPTADDPIYFALSGNLDRPAIKDFHPGLSSDVLYVTNGETTDYAARRDRRAGMDARAVGGLPELRVRVPGRRGARAGGVRAQPPVRAVGRQVGRSIRTTRCRCSASRRSRSIRRATTRTRTGSRASTSSSPTPTASSRDRT